jgi:hypothetical protein
MRHLKRSCWVLALLVLALNCRASQAGFFCCGWSCGWCCYPCYPCYPCYSYYSFYPTPVVISAPVIVPASPRVMPLEPTSITVGTLPPSVVRTEPDVVQRGFSVVRRKLLLKNRGPEDAPGLYLRAVRAYDSRDYAEALDLAWAAVQLDGQDGRFWYAKSLSERALGDMESARASARRGAALDVLAGDEILSGVERAGTAERAFLRQASAGVTRATARQITGEPAPIEPLASAARGMPKTGPAELARKTP